MAWGGECCSCTTCTLTLQVIGSNPCRNMTIPTDFLVVVLSSCTHIQSVPGFEVNISGYNSRADAESKMSYILAPSSQQFRSYEF